MYIFVLNRINSIFVRYVNLPPNNVYVINSSNVLQRKKKNGEPQDWKNYENRCP